jgi:hypothetical protein
MEDDQPDFYLVSTELSVSYDPKKCWRIKRLEGVSRDDLLLIRVEPPFTELGSHGDMVVIAPRLVGSSLFPISEWPLHVYLHSWNADNERSQNAVREGELRLLDWAALFPTEEEALRYLGMDPS